MSQGNDQSPAGGGYERPDNRYRCGRGAAWRTPCAHGPNGGQCGGTSECQPALKDGRLECRRPAGAGGPCKEGPKSDGSCSHPHPPCVPQLTLRARRGRIAWQLCALLLLLLAAGFHFGRGLKSRPPTADPGPLSAKHAHFAASQSCAACHAAHGAGLGGLLKATFRSTDMNAQCAACHQFAGPADRPHNETSAGHAGARGTDCRMCHTEHRGANANLVTLADDQCHSCHKVKFERFDLDHPPFPTGFPQVTRAGIKFDHARHLLDYFKQPDQAPRAPQACAECHAATKADRTIRTAGFDTTCARCHAAQIPQNELVLLRLPEPAADAAKLGPDDATAFMAWFFQRTNAGTNYGIALQQLLAATAKDGVAPLGSALNAQLAGPPASGPTNLEPNAPDRRSTRPLATDRQVSAAALLAGLSPELAQRPAQLWLKREKFEPSTLPGQSGWFWLEDLLPELHYKPAAHADPVARAWIEFAIAAAARATNADDAKRAVAFRNEITLQNSGLGRCLKCHVTSAPASSPANWHIAWSSSGSQLPAHTKFSHGAHLGVVRCEACHALNPQADFAGQFKDFTTTTSVSSFKSISVANCTSCHAQNKVRNDCALCHEYHRDPHLKDFATAASAKP